MFLGDLIEWLEKQDQELIIKDGFGEPHTDRGDYMDLAFDPENETKISEMLIHARSAINQTFTGYKGGEYTMWAYSNVLIGVFGECGEHITKITLKYWLLTGRKATNNKE